MAVEAKWRVRAPRSRKRQSGAAAGIVNGGQGEAARGATTHYVWRIAPKDLGRTRPDHLRLNGRKFRWDDPPIVNARTGERGHPGMDAHCRCYAEPVPE